MTTSPCSRQMNMRFRICFPIRWRCHITRACACARIFGLAGPFSHGLCVLGTQCGPTSICSLVDYISQGGLLGAQRDLGLVLSIERTDDYSKQRAATPEAGAIGVEAKYVAGQFGTRAKRKVTKSTSCHVGHAAFLSPVAKRRDDRDASTAPSYSFVVLCPSGLTTSSTSSRALRTYLGPPVSSRMAQILSVPRQRIRSASRV
jgi:hypothetical protein